MSRKWRCCISSVPSRDVSTTRKSAWPRSIPTSDPARGARPRATAGRPPAPDALVPSSTSTSASIRSAASVETAEVDRPVTRARSARLLRGLDYSAATTACPLRLAQRLPTSRGHGSILVDPVCPYRDKLTKDRQFVLDDNKF